MNGYRILMLVGLAILMLISFSKRSRQETNLPEDMHTGDLLLGPCKIKIQGNRYEAECGYLTVQDSERSTRTPSITMGECVTLWLQVARHREAILILWAILPERHRPSITRGDQDRWSRIRGFGFYGKPYTDCNSNTVAHRYITGFEDDIIVIHHDLPLSLS